VARKLDENIDFIVSYHLGRLATPHFENIDPLVHVFTKPPY